MPDSSKDPAIKLFGQNIPVPEHVFAAEPPRGVPPYNHDIHATKAVVGAGYSWDKLYPGAGYLGMVLRWTDECGEAERSEADGAPIQKSSEQDAPGSGKCEEMNCRDILQDGEVQENKKPEHEPAVGSEMKSEQKVLKKPDKIIPCPRCNSMDTKFCYFNNYNVNQPRHFCRNCQRYWTAGGTVRNVPVGSGRRKNKHASSLYHQVVLSPPVVPVAQAEVLNSAGQWHLSGVGAPISPRPIEGFGAVLNLPTFPYLCQSMATALNLTEHKGKVESSSGSTDNNDEVPKSCGSSSISTDLRENQLLTKEMKQCGVTDRSYGSPPAHPLQLHPGCPLLYPWNPCGNAKAVTPEASNSTPFYMACPSLMLSGFCSPNTAVPVVPVANWNFTPRTPFFPSTSCASPSSSTTSSGCSCDNTPTLGKHSRDTNLQAEKTEKSQWVPKTLRVNDPKDAAKSPKRNRESATKSNMLKALNSRSDFTSRASL